MPAQSGHDFQYRIEDKVKALGFETFPEESYMDDVELKPRKIDFVATQQRESHNPRGNQLALVVECKYLTQDVECYTRPNPFDEDAYFIDGYAKQNLDRNRFHFLTIGKVIVNIKQEKSADLYGATYQASKALLYLRGSQRILDKKGLFFPVVVYGGPGKIVDQDGKKLTSAVYFTKYEWKQPHTQDRAVSRSLYVDIIHESEMEAFLENIHKREMDAVMGLVRFEEAMAEKKVGERRENQWRNSAR